MPRDLIVTENITLDGVIDASEGWFTVTDEAGRADMSAVEKAHRESADAVLFGRVTFERWRATGRPWRTTPPASPST